MLRLKSNHVGETVVLLTVKLQNSRIVGLMVILLAYRERSPEKPIDIVRKNIIDVQLIWKDDWVYLYILQLIMSFPTQILHPHYLHHQACPPRKVLSSLSCSCLRIILFPSKSSTLPFTEDVVDQVFSKLCIHISGLLAVWAW